MYSTFHSIETAKRSLFAQQVGLATTGQNIANANTAGYSRQVVNMSASKPMEAVGMMRSSAAGQLGTGVEVGSITRVRAGYLDDQFRNQNQSLGAWEIRYNSLDKLQTIFNEPSNSGLRTVLDNFWKSWASLAQDPENETGRKIVRENAITLSDTFNQISKQLADMKADLTSNIQSKTTQINSITGAVANLNDQILRIEGLGNNANDLRDQRDQLTDQLSKILNIQVQDTPQGYTITTGGGISLVEGNAASPVTADALEGAVGSGAITGGEIYGMVVSRDVYVADYIAQLDALANTIANGDISITIPAGSVLPDGTVLDGVTYSDANGNRVLSKDLPVTVKGLNGLHQLGYTFENPLSRGVEFFTSKDGGAITAASIQLNTAIRNDATKIATSLRTTGTGTAETPVKGNNTLAMVISQLKDIPFAIAGASSSKVVDGTLDDYYRAMIGQLGVQSEEAERQIQNQQTLAEYVDSQRQSVSGVSLDEEMSNMIKFQHAYGAAARFMTTIDQILDKLINGTGMVGR